MSKPTRGMVAGQPIKTGAQTKEWDEGFDRTFGDRKPVRGRFVYTSGGKPLEEPVRVDEEWRDPGLEVPKRSEEEVYGSLTPATDGTRLDTRKRHRDYMKATNTTLADDFKETWAKAAESRAEFIQGKSTSHAKELRESVGQALYEVRRRKR